MELCSILNLRLETLFFVDLDYSPLTSFEALRTHENGLVEPHLREGVTLSRSVSSLHRKMAL